MKKILLGCLGIDLELHRNNDIFCFSAFSPFEFQNNLMTVCIYTYIYKISMLVSTQIISLFKIYSILSQVII